MIWCGSIPTKWCDDSEHQRGHLECPAACLMPSTITIGHFSLGVGWASAAGQMLCVTVQEVILFMPPPPSTWLHPMCWTSAGQQVSPSATGTQSQVVWVKTNGPGVPVNSRKITWKFLQIHANYLSSPKPSKISSHSGLATGGPQGHPRMTPARCARGW